MTSVRRIQFALLSVAAAVVLAVVVFIARAPREGDDGAKVAEAKPPQEAPLRPKGPRKSQQPPEAVITDAVNVKLDHWLGSERNAVLTAGKMTELEGALILSGSGGVRIDAEGTDKHGYVIRAKEMRVTSDYQEVRAYSGVSIDRDDGLSLDAKWFTHDNKTGLESSGGAVRVETAGRFLACERLEYQTREDAFQLDGGVAAIDHSERGPVFAAGEHLQFNRKTGELVLRERVQVVAGRLSIRADRLDLNLVKGKPTEAVFRSLDGRVVEVEVQDPTAAGCGEADAGGGGMLSAPLRVLRAPGLRVLFEAGEARSIRPIDPRTPVLVEGFDPEKVAKEQQLWTLWAKTLEATLASGGRVERLEGTGIDWTSQDRTRSLQAAEMDVSFDGSGSLQVAEFPKGVTIAEADRLLTGRKGRLAGGVLVVEGDPRLVAGMSRLKAKRIELETKSGKLRAEGDVETESPQARNSTLPLRSDDNTVRCRADHMETTGSGNAVYRGGARAWQGGDVLQADEIRADKDFAGLAASGSVHVLLTSDPTRRTQASSDNLSLKGDMVTLDGAVKVEVPDARVSSQKARMFMGPGGGPMERLEAEGDPVRVERQGVVGTSRRMNHDVVTGRTDLYGDGSTVRVVDEKGQESLGDSLVLWRRGERISLGAGREALVLSKVGTGRTP